MREKRQTTTISKSWPAVYKKEVENKIGGGGGKKYCRVFSTRPLRVVFMVLSPNSPSSSNPLSTYQQSLGFFHSTPLPLSLSLPPFLLLLLLLLQIFLCRYLLPPPSKGKVGVYLSRPDQTTP